MDMSFWSKPIGRLTGVLVAIVLTVVAMFVVWVGVAIAFTGIGNAVRTANCPDFTVDHFPEECLAHMGDWVPGEEADGDSDFVWFGTQSELSSCFRTMQEESQARVDAFFNETMSAECYEKYERTIDRYGDGPRLEYRGRILDETEINTFGFITPTPSP